MHPLSGFTVLIVGLPQGESVALSTALSDNGCRCLSVADGFEAVKMITAKAPDALFVDANTLRLDGYALCAIVRNYPESRKVRVVLRLGEDSAFDSVRAQLSGADYVITDAQGPRASVAAELVLRALKGG